MKKQLDLLQYHDQVYATKKNIQSLIATLVRECFWEKRKEKRDSFRLRRLANLLLEARIKLAPKNFNDMDAMCKIDQWCHEVTISLNPQNHELHR